MSASGVRDPTASAPVVMPCSTAAHFATRSRARARVAGSSCCSAVVNARAIWNEA
jgi:hypothetical protein